MARKLVSSHSALEPKIGFSRAVRSGRYVAVEVELDRVQEDERKRKQTGGVR